MNKIHAFRSLLLHNTVFKFHFYHPTILILVQTAEVYGLVPSLPDEICDEEKRIEAKRHD